MAEEQEKPLTRDEVLKMIEEHGGPEGLDLSGRNLTGIDLSTPIGSEEPPLYLRSIILAFAKLQKAELFDANLEEADLRHANLQEAYLRGANLQKVNLTDANLQNAILVSANLERGLLWGTNLQGANLAYANLQGASLIGASLQHAYLRDASAQGAIVAHADLRGAMLQGAHLQRADLSHCDLRGAETNLVEADLERATLYGCDLSGASIEGINWGRKYIAGDEVEAEKETDRDKKRERLGEAASVYRNLKRWHTEQGLYNLTGEFYFREMTVRRKALKWWPNPLPRTASKFLAVLCGYGEKPERVVVSAAAIVLVLAGIYSASALSFLDSLYHSAVSFTALGYGLGASTAQGWVKGLGAFEAFIGVFMMALFLITFVRKMTR